MIKDIQTWLIGILCGLAGVTVGMVISVNTEETAYFEARIATLEARQPLPSITVTGPANIWTEDKMVAVEGK